MGKDAVEEGRWMEKWRKNETERKVIMEGKKDE